VQLAALKQITGRISKAITAAEARLKTAKRVRLAGDIAAVLGSSSVLAGSAKPAAIAGSHPSAAIAASAAIALLGALAGVLSEYAVRLPSPGGGSLFEIYSSLGEARFEAENLTVEIETLLSAQESDDVAKPLGIAVGAANTLCRKVQKSLSQILENAR
jgi:hypothetical protein